MNLFNDPLCTCPSIADVLRDVLADVERPPCALHEAGEIERHDAEAGHAHDRVVADALHADDAEREAHAERDAEAAADLAAAAYHQRALAELEAVDPLGAAIARQVGTRFTEPVTPGGRGALGLNDARLRAGTQARARCHPPPNQ